MMTSEQVASQLPDTSDTGPVQLVTPSLTVTVPVCRVAGLKFGATLTVTTTGWPVTEGAGTSEMIVVVVTALWIVMLRVCVSLCGLLPGPVTFMVKLKTPLGITLSAGTPEISPVLALRVKPGGKLPLIMLQVAPV